jgi:hypothetical protein
MLVVITFQAYLSISAAVLLVYYSALYFINRKSPAMQVASPVGSSAKNTVSEERLKSSVHDLVDELQNCISSYTGKQKHKAEILPVLHCLVRKYPELKDTQFVKPINHLIAHGCEKHLNIHVNAEEQVALWN